MTSAPANLDDVPRETADRLERLEALVREEALAQNLVSAATLPDFRTRHILDSLQLIPLAPTRGRWLDIGSGAGFPGMVIAIASPLHDVTLVEPRALRAGFLQRLVDTFDLGARVRVKTCKVERLTDMGFDVVSARAVAPLERLFAIAEGVTDTTTQWVLPKGRSARDELEQARRTWQGTFRLVPSRTDPDAAILVATGVKRRTKR